MESHLQDLTYRLSTIEETKDEDKQLHDLRSNEEKDFNFVQFKNNSPQVIPDFCLDTKDENKQKPSYKKEEQKVMKQYFNVKHKV